MTTPVGWGYPTQPPPQCVKCGNPYGFMSSEPEYRGPDSAWHTSIEFLEWTCASCGYRVITKTADYKP